MALKREVPERDRGADRGDPARASGWSPDERTLQRHFVRLELTTRPDGQPPRAFGRFEADAPNERWTGDALHGPTVNGRKAILFAFLDDHSRLLHRLPVGPPRGHRAAGGRAAHRHRHPRHPRLDLRRQRIGVRGQAAAARVRVAGDPAGALHGPASPPAGARSRGSFRTVREQFLVEIGSGRELDDLAQLNTLFTAWVETVYHRRDALRDRADAARPLVGARRPGRCRRRRSCARRSCGRSGAPSPRPPPSACTATPTRSTPPWSAARSNWSSTRST